MKKIIATTVLVILGLSSVAYADNASADSNELVKVSKGVFKETWVNPTADLTKYTKIMIADGEFEFRDVKKGPSLSGYSRSSQNDFWVSDKDKARATEMISEVFGQEIAKTKSFEIVNTAGPDVLVLRGGLKDIVSHVPPQMMGPGESYISKIGTATVVIEAVDSTTGEVIFNASERSKIQRGFNDLVEANSVQVNAEIRRWTRKVASKLVKGLDSIHS